MSIFSLWLCFKVDSAGVAVVVGLGVALAEGSLSLSRVGRELEAVVAPLRVGDAGGFVALDAAEELAAAAPFGCCERVVGLEVDDGA